MNSYIYEITNNITKAKYIGVRSCECQIEKDKYKGENTVISKDYREYGKKNFSSRVLSVIINDNMKEELLELYLKYGDYIFLEEHEDGNIPTKRTGKSNSGPSRKVICLNTKEVYNSVTEAAFKCDTNMTGIIHACNPNSNRNHAGKDSDGNPLKWMYYDAYLAELNGETYDYTSNKLGPKTHRTKPVRCKETGEEFDSIKEAAEKYNVYPGSISNSCRAFDSAGKHPDTGQKLYWEYIKNEDEE